MAIKDLSSKTVNVKVVDASNAKFKALDKAQSVNMGLPEEFTVPNPPEFAIMTFNNLKDADGNPREGLGVGIKDKDGKEKVVTISSLSRKYFSEEVTPGDTRGKQQIAVIDVFQDENTMQLSPSQQVEKLAGKTVKKDTEVTVWLADFKDGEVTGYTESTKAIYKAS